MLARSKQIMSETHAARMVVLVSLTTQFSHNIKNNKWLSAPYGGDCGKFLIKMLPYL